MKIGIDARPLQGETQYRGIGKALEFLLTALASQDSHDLDYVFYVDKGLPRPPLLKMFKKHRIIEVPTSRLGRTRYIRSVLPSYRPIKPSPSDVDVLLQYDASLGVPTTVPTVTAFHDLIPILFRGQEKQKLAKGTRRVKNALARNMYWQKYLRVLKSYRRSALIIPISQASKIDLLKYYRGISGNKVKVVPLGVNQKPSYRDASHEVRKLAAKPYLLYVGGIDLRKNIVELLRTFYALKPEHPDLRLICVGKEFDLDDQMTDLGWFDILGSQARYAKDVLLPGFLSDTDVQYLYAHAKVFVFPSRYEGFGLPILEAMQASCPVVAYNNSSIPEVAGEAALLVEENQPMASAVQQVLSDPTLRDRLIAKGLKQARAFTWEETAIGTLKALKKAAGK